MFSKKKIVLCFDIDGVVCNTKNSDYKNSKPIKKNINIINKLYLKGYHIKLYTARFMGRTNDNKRLAEKKAKKITVSQLKKWNLHYHNIYFGKISYDIIVDDKSIFYKKNWANDINYYLKKNKINEI